MKLRVFDPALHAFADPKVLIDHDCIGNLNPSVTGRDAMIAFGVNVIVEDAFLRQQKVTGDWRLTPQQRVPYRRPREAFVSPRQHWRCAPERAFDHDSSHCRLRAVS